MATYRALYARDFLDVDSNSVFEPHRKRCVSSASTSPVFLIDQIQNLPYFSAILRHILDLHDRIGSQNECVYVVNEANGVNPELLRC